jgi:hypothetical protein
MNPLDDSLQQLLDAASKARRDVPETPPFSVEARVLAQWRSVRVEDDFTLLVRQFRRAFVFALLIMVLSGAWNYFENRNQESTTVLMDYAMQMQLPP